VEKRKIKNHCCKIISYELLFINVDTQLDILKLVREAAKKEILFLLHEDYLAVITAYLPNPQQWVDNLRKRRGS